ncbi:MAG: trimethylamine methyltransferase family protein [Alphaproteobacteria bacterium]|nr:trimethylamine methyltransferase family protein [Alphaproteobacteria bacterium]
MATSPGTSTKTSTGRAGGRRARVAKRTTPGEMPNPCPPGQVGGTFKPLDDHGLKQIMDTAYRLLDEIGMGEVPHRFQDLALAKGAHLNSSGRLCYSRAMVEDVIDGAAREFILHGRDARHDIEIGGERVYFGTGGAAVQTLDMDSGEYRPSTLNDLYDFTRLIDTLDNVSWFTRCCVATDVPDLIDLDINTAYALMRGTTKHVGTSFTVAETVAPIISMFDRALGGEGKYRQRPFCKAHISPVISPMRYGEDAVDVTFACIEHGVPINAIIAAQSGATAPAPLAGMLAQTTAETLAGLMLVNLIAPGYTMIFSNWPLVIDLRTGAFCGGGGEISLLNAASGQIANHLGLPGGVASSMADAKAVDAQMGMEKALSALSAGLAGANMVYESSGMMASLLGASFEAFVLDNEMLSHVHRAIRGIEVSDESLSFEAIQAAITGDGHFLGGDDTIEAMLRDYYYPALADRNDPATWANLGGNDAWQNAQMKARDVLATHHPDYLTADADQWMRDNFNILLS